LLRTYLFSTLLLAGMTTGAQKIKKEDKQLQNALQLQRQAGRAPHRYQWRKDGSRIYQ
jgi:hypothetical protein